jgi:hypothetical protein
MSPETLTSYNVSPERSRYLEEFEFILNGQ